MSEEYDHRWEALAEVHFNAEEDLTDENYLYCLCSRVFIRDGVKYYYVDKEEASESDAECGDTTTQDDHSHVHFSAETSYKVKCEKDEGASCYCSATHTDNYCSTDEHDPAQNHGIHHSLQPSDSGADLTYPDIIPLDHSEKMQTESEYPENYLSQDTWGKFWSINGERLIWASWIEKYSDYINPAYLGENSDFVDNTSKRENSLNQIFNTKETLKSQNDDDMRERKFSYDSKVNPYKKNLRTDLNLHRTEKVSDKEEAFVSIGRRRSCSEHDRIISPKPIDCTDSMTNVTKITLSSYDITSSHVTSESNSTDEYSVSSSDDNCDQTKIANIEETLDKSFSEDMDPDQYWQFLWKQHFGEQYAMHYSNYIECLSEASQETPPKPDNRIQDLILEVDCESEGNSQELPSVIEVQNHVEKITLDEKPKAKKRNKKSSSKYSSSVGVLLQSLIKEETKNPSYTEVVEAGEESGTKKQDSIDSVDGSENQISGDIVQQTWTNSIMMNKNTGDGEEPPDERPVNLKRSHEIDDEQTETEKIKSTFEMIGLCLRPDSVPKGQLVYRKRLNKLRPPKPRRFGFPKKTLFDEDGEPIEVLPPESHEEREMQTDEDCPEVKSDCEQDMTEDTIDSGLKYANMSKEGNRLLEAISVPLPDFDGSFSDQDCIDLNTGEIAQESIDVYPVEQTKRRRKKRRQNKGKIQEESELPPELRADPRLRKYWKKRHSLFHRFDSGIRLDAESWFSVTPEGVARHAAARCRCDVIVDAFCGAGGNATQLAFTCERVIAIDISPEKVSLARHNATVYGVADRIEFIVGDFFELAPTLKADVVFLSPPWGGPAYVENAEYDLETMLQPQSASRLMEAAQQISSNIALYVPRNTKTEQLVALARHSGCVEIEQNFLGRRFVALTAYYGELVN